MQIVPNWPVAFKWAAAAVFVAGLPLLAGYVVEPLQAAAPPAAAPPVAAPPVEDTTSITIKRTAVAGMVLRVNFATAINPDCSSLPLFTVRIMKPPAHGVVKIEAGEEFPTFPPTNVRSECNKQRVPGILVGYTADADYTGADTFVLHTISPNGLVQNQTYLITVE
jgi:hypothetical protein